MIKQHYKILLWTARPVDEYPVLKEFTKGWLNKNEIYYDDIIWNCKLSRLQELENWVKEIEYKGESIKDYEVYAIEDQRNTANSMANSGIVKEVFLIDWIYNMGETHSNVYRFSKYIDLWKYFMDKIEYEK